MLYGLLASQPILASPLNLRGYEYETLNPFRARLNALPLTTGLRRQHAVIQ